MSTKKKYKVTADVELAKADPATLRKQMRAGQWRLAKILGWRLRLKNITPAELDKTGSGFMMRFFIPEYTAEFKKRVDGIPKAVRNLLGSDLKGKMQTREGEGGGLIIVLPVGTGMLKKIRASDFGRKDVERMEIEQRNMMSLRERRSEPAMASVELAKKPLTREEQLLEIQDDTKKKFKTDKKKLKKLKPGVSGEVFKGANKLKAFLKAMKKGFEIDESHMSTSEIFVHSPKRPFIRFSIKRNGDECEASIKMQMTKTVKDDNWLLDVAAAHPEPVGAFALLLVRAAEIIADRRSEFMSDFGGRVFWAADQKALKKMAAPYQSKSSKKKSEPDVYGAEHEEDGE